MVGEDILLYLDAQGLGDKTSNLMLGSQPETPDNCCTIFEETAPVEDESQGFAVDNMGIQLIERNTDYRTARDNIMAKHKAIAMFQNGKFHAGGVPIRSCMIESSPSSIGKDNKDRSEWTAHYRVAYETTGNANRTTK